VTGRALLWLATLGGFLIGPGYFLYTRYFTGAVVAVHQLGLPAGAGGARSAEVALEPAMSPVRFILRVSTEHGPSLRGAPRNRCRTVIEAEDKSVASSEIELVSNSIESTVQEFAEVLATLEVPRPAVYRVTLEEGADPGMNATRTQVEVRRNVREPDTRIVWAGVALLLAGLVRLILTR
jgi:hypothetical protein